MATMAETNANYYFGFINISTEHAKTTYNYGDKPTMNGVSVSITIYFGSSLYKQLIYLYDYSPNCYSKGEGTDYDTVYYSFDGEEKVNGEYILKKSGDDIKLNVHYKYKIEFNDGSYLDLMLQGSASYKVVAPEPTSIRVVKKTNVDYYVGGKVTLSNYSVYANFTNENGTFKEEVTGYTTTPAIGSVWEDGDKLRNLTVSYRNKIKQIYVNVYTLQEIYVENAKTIFTTSDVFHNENNYRVVAKYTNGVTKYITNYVTYSGRPSMYYPVGSESFYYTINYTDNYEAPTTGLSKSLVVNCDVLNVNDYSSINSIYITNDKTTSFNYGDPFSLGNGKVMVKMTDTSKPDAEIQSGYSISYAVGKALDRKESLTITISYGIFSTSYDIHIKYLDSITTNFSSMATEDKEFFLNDYFSCNSLVVNAVYKSTDTSVSDVIEDVTDDININYSNDIQLSTVGTYPVVIDYDNGNQSVSTTYNITVSEIEVVSISVDSTGLSSSIEGEKLFYNGHTNVTKNSKLIVTGVCNNGSTREIDISDYTISPLLFNEVGTKNITITYDGKTATYPVTVLEHEVTSLSLDTTNVTKNFLVGDSFECEGLVVKAIYNSGYVATLSSNQYTLSPLINYVFLTNDYGTKSVTATSGSLSASYNLTVNYPLPKRLIVNTNTINLQPINNSVFDVSLITVQMEYTNGLKKDLIISSSETLTTGRFNVNTSTLNLDDSNMINVSEFGQKEIVVTGASTFDATKTITSTFNVSIVPNKQLLNIYIDDTNAKKVYKTGEKFTGEGFKIMASYLDTEGYTAIDVSVDNSSISTSNPSLGSTIYNAGNLEVVFTYNFLNKSLSTTYVISVIPSYKITDSTKKTLRIVKLKNLEYEEVNTFVKNSDGYIWALYDINDTDIDTDETSATYGKRIIKPNLTNVKCYGIVTEGKQTSDTAITTEKAKVILFEDYIPPVEGQSNIKVTFPHYVSGAADKINHCTFGILFGNNNARNRLFVSGNKDSGMGNLDWHSSEINVSQTENYNGNADGDLSYFSDLDYCAYGQTSNKVCGYDVMSNGTLMVLKTPSNQEPTIYYRTASFIQATTGDGALVETYSNTTYEESFPLTIGNIGDGGINNRSIINFQGDSLFLSKNGLKGIDVSSNISDSRKYANDRSYLINKQLIKQDLTKAYLHKFGDWLFLNTPDKTYVANYNYKTEDKQYEWWVLDNIPSTIMFENNNKLYFGNSSGELSIFHLTDEVETYSDKYRYYIGLGGILPLILDDDEDTITFNSKYAEKFINGYKINIIANTYDKNMYALLGNFINKESLANSENENASDYEGYIDVENNYLKISCVGEVILKDGSTISKTDYINQLFHDGKSVYLDNISQIMSSSSNDTGVEYLIRTQDEEGIDLDEYCFRLQKKNGEFADLTRIEKVRISFVLDDNCTICDVDQENYTCKVLGDHDHKLDFIQYNNQAMNGFSGIITTDKPIKSYYITKPFNLGTNLNYKIIWGWSVVNDTQLKSRQDIGYRIDNLSNGESFETGQELFNLNKYDFENFSFNIDMTMPTIFSTDKMLEDIKYISFVFKNQEDTNCVLTNLSIEYSIGLPMWK